MFFLPLDYREEPRPQGSPAMLDLKRDSRRWEYDDGKGMLIAMTNATYLKYVNALLADRGLTEPTEQQRRAARQQCQRVSYWRDVADPDVRKVRFENFKESDDVSDAITDNHTGS